MMVVMVGLSVMIVVNYGSNGRTECDGKSVNMMANLAIINIWVIKSDCHGELMRRLSSVLTNALRVRSQPGTDYFVLSVCCCVRFLASLCYQEYSCMYSYMLELTV